MYMKLLSVACIAACAIGSPKQPHDITAIDVDHAIQRIKTELLGYDMQTSITLLDAVCERVSGVH